MLPSGLEFQLVVDARPIVLDEAVKEPPPLQLQLGFRLGYRLQPEPEPAVASGGAAYQLGF